MDASDGMPVSQLIWLVKKAVTVSGVSRLSQTHDLRVASVQVILEVVAAKSFDGDISFRVPFTDARAGVGAGQVKHDTQTVDITLVPPARPKPLAARSLPAEEALVDAIATIREAMATAATGEDPWELSQSTVNITFGVSSTKGISLVAHGERSSDTVQTLRLTLKPVSRAESADAG